MTPAVEAVAADAVATYGTDVAATITTTAALYVARVAKKILLRFERYDRVLFGDDQIDGREGIVNIALENERRSLENRDAIRHVEPPDLEHHADD